MQNGSTPAYIASAKGHAETVVFLLTNKADINAANKVQQFKMFKYLSVIDDELGDFNIAFFILSRVKHMKT